MIFETESSCDSALEVLASNPNKHSLNISKSKSGKRFVKVAPTFTEARLDHHLALSKQLIQALDKEQGINSNIIIEDFPASKLFKFDLQVLYLRKVHSYCYFSAAEYTDERMLTAKCGLAFLRFKLSSQLVSKCH